MATLEVEVAKRAYDLAPGVHPFGYAGRNQYEYLIMPVRPTCSEKLSKAPEHRSGARGFGRS